MADHLLQEVDADLRAEQLQQLWLRWRKPLVFAVIAAILGTAAFSAYEAYREKRGGERFYALVTAQNLYQQGNYAEAAAAFAKAADEAGPGDARTLAFLWQGRSEAAAGKKDAAIATYRHAANASPSLWSDLACLRLVSLDNSATDCLSGRSNSPLSGIRQEWHAASLAQAGKTDEAIAILDELATSPDTTEADRSQITQWLASLRAQPKAAPAAAKAE